MFLPEAFLLKLSLFVKFEPNFDLSPFDTRRYSWADPTNEWPSDSAYFAPDSYAIITDFDLNEDKLFLPAIHGHAVKITYESKSIIFDDILSTGIYATRRNSQNSSDKRNFDDNLVAVVHGISKDNFDISNHIDFIGTLGPNNYVTSNGTTVASAFTTDPFDPVNMNPDWSTPSFTYGYIPPNGEITTGF